MTDQFDKFAARAARAIFMLLWSTGFIGTKYVLHDAEPSTYLAIRMALVVVLMAIIAVIGRPQWPDRIGVMYSIVAGLLVHGFYLGGTAVAISLSIPAGLSALMPGLQPILTSTIANRWLGERVTPLQWLGLLLGLGGVVLILHDRPLTGQAGWGWFASAVSLVSITLGTLRRYCSRIDWRAGNLVQYLAVTVFFAAGAFLFEIREVHWTGEFVLSVAWLAVMLSIGSIGLLYWLIRRSAATSVASLFYLVPAGDLGHGLRPV
jgi:drug/metabolite transporter (DMT)-like permease